MAYELHITRQKDLFDEDDARRISMEEWKEYVDADPDMRLDNYSEIIAADKVLRLEGDGLSVWTKYSGDGIEGGHAWFGYYEGSIAVKNPDDEIIGKMLEIAESLRLSATTISTYRSRILAKMNLKTNSDLTRYALENKLI